MQPVLTIKLNGLLKSLSSSKKIVKELMTEETIDVLYKNGIDLNVVEVKALSDVVKGKSDTHLADSLDESRAIWNEIVDKVR